jgi:sulfite exporter TauE/SafE
MCGGFSCLYGGGAASWRLHWTYNLGRLASYLALGLIAGVLGHAVTQAGTLLGISRLAGLVSGMLLIAWGTAAVRRALGKSTRRGRLASASTNAIHGVLGRLAAVSPPGRAAAIGCLSTLLPCGWLYAFAATAAGTGAVGPALLVMFVFWLGTLPAMLGTPFVLRRVAGPLAARLPLVAACVIIAVGAVSVASRLLPVGGSASPQPIHAHGR